MRLFSDTLPFYRGNLHTHTTESDGRKTPEACMEAYRAAGYDFLSLTDHRTVTQTSGAPGGLVMIPGIELDYQLPGQCVHLLGLGVGEHVARHHGETQTPQEGIDLIRGEGGLAILNHPAWSLNTPALIASLKGLAGAEIWNSVSTLPYNALRADASSLLDVAAAQGCVLPLMANDDTHFYGAEFAVGWNMVQAEEKTPESILAALAAGRFYCTQGPAIHQAELCGGVLKITCSPAQAVVFYSNLPWSAERNVLGENVTEASYVLQPGETFVRAQVVDAAGRSAWLSPLALPAEG